MAKPNAWSHTALSDFENCPKQYHEVKVLKRWPFSATAEMQWGRDVHKSFEDYLLKGDPLPTDLLMHEEFLAHFKALPGELAGEEKIALNTSLRACSYFAKDVWYRGQVDARKRDRAAGFSYILDHKTGKVKNDFAQLKMFALHEFITQPDIHEVRVEYYWTQIRGSNGEVYHREQMTEMWNFFAPKLERFADAFITGNFPPKQSGLCRGWCPVNNCEFWSPKRARP